MEHTQPSQPHKISTKTTINFVEAVRTNWQLIMFAGSIIFVLITMYFGLKDVQAQSIENKADIKTLDSRISNVEGDIKAIRAGVDFLVNAKQ